MPTITTQKYYNIGNAEKYLVQTKYQTGSSAVKLPTVQGVSKNLDLNNLTRKTEY